MRTTAIRACGLALLAASVIACRATLPPASEAPESAGEIPLLVLPREAEAEELLARARSDAFRFRRVVIGQATYYVPYLRPRAYPAYVPYYTSYDPDYYYVPAFASPGFGGSSRLVRYGRREAP